MICKEKFNPTSLRVCFSVSLLAVYQSVPPSVNLSVRLLIFPRFSAITEAWQEGAGRGGGGGNNLSVKERDRNAAWGWKRCKRERMLGKRRRFVLGKGAGI